ncbi:Uncharacterized protein SCF082_LOCUS46109 [Durusdinium trenchii]|uniref:Uncharacterized protein n=1 Tax=Durusdinium trenchii TaxID=1381693 RepID=A0ABP0RDZ5_9DINO
MDSFRQNHATRSKCAMQHSFSARSATRNSSQGQRCKGRSISGGTCVEFAQATRAPAWEFPVLLDLLFRFFDAEGSISVAGSSCTLRMEINQKIPFVLEELHFFLRKNDLNKWTLKHLSSGYYKLRCVDTATCKLTLQRLLKCGLDVKKKQAALALSLTPDNHKQVREAIHELNGYQTRYQRLDDKGVERAKDIQRVGNQLRNASSQQKLETLRVKLGDLREEHTLQNLVTKCRRLRRHIRQSLQEGGVMMPIRQSRIG